MEAEGKEGEGKRARACIQIVREIDRRL